MLLVFSLLFWEEVEFVNHSSSEVPGTAVAISQKEPTTAQRDHNTAASKIKSAVSRIPTKQRLAFIVDSNGQHSSYLNSSNVRNAGVEVRPSTIPSQFPEKLMALLDSKVAPDAVWWLRDVGDITGAFAINKKIFSELLLNTRFNGNKWPSITRNLNRWYVPCTAFVH